MTASLSTTSLVVSRFNKKPRRTTPKTTTAYEQYGGNAEGQDRWNQSAAKP